MKEILELLKAHGGKVHGPNVETVSIPLDNFAELIRKAVEEENERCASIAMDMFHAAAQGDEIADAIRSRSAKEK